MTQILSHEPKSSEQIVAAIEMVRDVLGGAAEAAYLFGSAVAGGLRAHSDLDILVVAARSLTCRQRADMMRRLLSISGRVGGPLRPIELTVVARPALSPWRHPASIELQYGEWMRPEIERLEASTWPRLDPDAVILIETARRAAISLFGRPASAILDAAPHAGLARAMMDLVPIILPGIEVGDDRRNGLLTLARIWTTLATGEICPKDEAASWALARLPARHRPVLAHARAAYLGEPENWSSLEPSVRPHIDHVISCLQPSAR